MIIEFSFDDLSYLATEYFTLRKSYIKKIPSHFFWFIRDARVKKRIINTHKKNLLAPLILDGSQLLFTISYWKCNRHVHFFCVCIYVILLNFVQKTFLCSQCNMTIDYSCVYMISNGEKNPTHKVLYKKFLYIHPKHFKIPKAKCEKKRRIFPGSVYWLLLFPSIELTA